jgi:DNA repair protein RecN (Recombination protein N)
MLVELAVRDLGVIENASLLLGPGMTALTGETGAGKTMIVQAIQLLTGGRAESSMVRTGASEAIVEGRFVLDGGDEVVLKRVVPANGRSRAYVDGSMATIANLAEMGERVVDLHGQHQHQSLLSPRVQRASLDGFAGIDLGPLNKARAEARSLRKQLSELGGDARARAHEIDLLRYQLNEIDDASIATAAEDDELEELADVLSDATEHRSRAEKVHLSLTGDNGVLDRIGDATHQLSGRRPFDDVVVRLRAAAAELDDVVEELRNTSEAIDDDPARLQQVRSRRQQLADLRRKYGDTLAEVLEFRDEIATRLVRLERHEEVAAELEQQVALVDQTVASHAKTVAESRRLAAPDLAGQINPHLPSLALTHARVLVEVSGDDPADDVEFLFAANSGSPEAPLSKVASGGELARVMLAVRLVLTAGPPTLVFDEVDAGVGGEAAVAVGRSLGRLGAENQVLVVTHLPQVAAFADRQVVVSKHDDGKGVHSSLDETSGDDRVRELARMLAGQPDSAAGREHASELLDMAEQERRQR